MKNVLNLKEINKPQTNANQAQTADKQIVRGQPATTAEAKPSAEPKSFLGLFRRGSGLTKPKIFSGLFRREFSLSKETADKQIVRSQPATTERKRGFSGLFRRGFSLAFGKRWLIPAGILVAIIVIVLSFALNIFNPSSQPETAKAAWFNDSWHYRQQFDIFNASTTQDLVDFQVRLATSTLALSTLFSESKINNDFSDLRFTDIGGNVLDYWHADATSTIDAVYVKMPSLPKNATSTIFMYYGNSSAVDIRDGKKVFPDFFEDFTDGNYDAGDNIWTVSAGSFSLASDSVNNNYLTTGSDNSKIYLPSTFSQGVWEFDLSENTCVETADFVFFSNSSNFDTDDNSYRIRQSTTGVFQLREWNNGSIGTIHIGSTFTACNTSWVNVEAAKSAGGSFRLTTAGIAQGTGSDTTNTTAGYIGMILNAGDKIDNIFYRQYASADPTITQTAGTSEEAGGGPIGYWSFDDGYGTTARDFSGSGNNGTLTNMSTTGTSTAWIAGKVGKALMFDGNNDYILIGDTSQSVKSLSFWFKANNLSKDIIDFDGGSHSLEISNGTITATGFIAPVIYIDGLLDDEINDNEWHQITVTTSTAFNASSLKIGFETSYFNGLIDEVKIFNYAISEEQILAEYNRGLAVNFSAEDDTYQGLAGWWKMDETVTAWDGTGDRVNDYSGNGLNGTASGDAKATTTAKYGNAGEFDGTGDYVSLADSSASALDLTGAGTVSAWIRPGIVTGSHYIIDKDETTAYALMLSGTTLYGYFGNTACSGGTLTASTWQYVGAVYDGQYVRCYLNGEEVGKTAKTGALTPQDTSLYLGSDGGSANDFNGMLDDVKIYNTIRTSDQIMSDYLEGPAPIAYWDFEEGSGTTLYDKSGQGNNSTAFAGSLGASDDWLKGQYGRALDFDGSDDSVSFGDDSDFDFNLQSFSVTGWFKFDDLTGYQILISKRSSLVDGVSGPGWLLVKRTGSPVACGTNSLHYKFKDVDGTIVTADVNHCPVIGQWYNFALVYDKKNTIKLYINGSEIKVSNTSTLDDLSSTSNLFLGQVTSGSFFNGALDEVKIFNYALTPWQITQEYNNGAPIVHWSFDEGYGTTAYDYSGNGKNGTLTNMSTTGTSTAWVMGKLNKALNFDGSNDTITVTDTTNSSLDFVREASISAWIKPSNVSGSKYIVDKDQTTAYSLMISGSTLYGYFDIGGSNSCSGGTIVANQWQHVTATYDGAYIRCYINGREVGKTADTGTIDVQNTSLYIGSDGGAASWFKGAIDEVKIYHHALSPQEINKDINESKAVVLGGDGQQVQEGLVGWWKMDETVTAWDGANDIIIDYSGNGFNGSAVNDAKATTTAKYGNAGEFDGDNDAVSITYNSALNPQKFTLQAWVNSNNLESGDTIIRSDPNTSNGFDLYVGSDASLNLGLNGGGRASTGAVSINTWYFVSATYDGQTAKIYLNGELKQSASYSTAITYGGVNLFIGRDSGSAVWHGLIDDVKLYNTARSADQIMSDYLEGPGVIAYYDFEEGSGTTLYDKSGQGNNSTAFAGSLGASDDWLKGQYGRALDFDGSDDSVSFGDDSDFDFNDQSFSVTGWFKFDDLTGYQVLIGKRDSLIDGSSGPGWLILKRSGSSSDCGAESLHYKFKDVDGTTITADVNHCPVVGQWYHMALAFEKKVSFKIYINGIEIKSNNTETLDDLSSPTDLIMGSVASGSYFNGSLDEVKIYNYALSPWQIAQEYNGGAPMGYWKMDEGEGGTIYDWSGNGNNGTLSLNGSPATSTAWQASTSCKKGKCLDFDGTDDKITITDSTTSSLDLSSRASLSAWIKPDNVTGSKYIFDKDQTTAYALMISGSTLYGYFDIGGSNSCSGGTIVANQWQHVTATYDGAYIRCYINGREVGKTADTGSIDVQDTSLYIGSDGGAANYFNGLIDEARIYNYALSPAQIRGDYSFGYGTYFE